AAIDQSGIALGAVCGTKAKALHDARPIALDQRVGRLDQRQRLLNRLRALEIQSHDAFSAPQRDVEERFIRIAKLGLIRANDRDDLGAEIGQHADGERTWADSLELDHLKARKRTYHSCPRSNFTT